MDDIQFKRVMLNLAALLVVGIFLTSLLKHYRNSPTCGAVSLEVVKRYIQEQKNV
jgi:hypothetical protein